MIDSIVWSNGSVPSSREHKAEMIRRKPLHTQQIDSLLLNNRGLVIWTYMNFRYLIIQFDSDASLSSWISCPAVCSASSLNLENSSFFSPFSAYTFWLSFNGYFSTLQILAFLDASGLQKGGVRSILLTCHCHLFTQRWVKALSHFVIVITIMAAQ